MWLDHIDLVTLRLEEGSVKVVVWSEGGAEVQVGGKRSCLLYTTSLSFAPQKKPIERKRIRERALDFGNLDPRSMKRIYRRCVGVEVAQGRVVVRKKKAKVRPSKLPKKIK